MHKAVWKLLRIVTKIGISFFSPDSLKLYHFTATRLMVGDSPTSGCCAMVYVAIIACHDLKCVEAREVCQPVLNDSA
jgi:hypothetical protein